MRLKRLVCLALVVLLLVALAASAFADNGDMTVYITKTGECYHTGACSYLSKSKIKISLEEAVDAGYRPCSRCKPPTLSRSSSRREESSSRSGGGFPLGSVAAGAALFGGGYALAKRKKG